MIRVLTLPIYAGVAFLVYQIFSFILQYLRQTIKARQWGCKPPPSLPVVDPFGIYLVTQLIKADNEKRMPDYQVDRAEQMNRQVGRVCQTYSLRMLPGKVHFVTQEPENVKAMLATQFKDYGLPRLRILDFIPMLGRGIFASNGERWEHSRALLRPQFIREQVSDLDLEERHVQNMMQILQIEGDGWTQKIDMQVLFFRLTMDSATEFLFGESVDSQLQGLPNSKNASSGHDEKGFAYAFDRGQMYLAKAARMGDLYWVAHNKEFKEMCKRTHDFIDYYVQRALDYQDTKKNCEKEKYVFLEQLAKTTKDPVQIRTELLNILLAGRDTTASMLGYLFVLLANHPEIFNKLRDTIIEHFGTYEQHKPITFQGLKNCQYLQWCMNETLRLYPVVPLNSRQAYKDTTLPVGGGPDGKSPVFIPAGREVMYSVYVIHRRKDLWGEDSHEWKPERWHNRRPGWEYLPFNGGPRICIGQQFALTEAGYVTVRLLQRFDKLDGQYLPPLRHGLTLTTCPADGVNIRLHAA